MMQHLILHLLILCTLPQPTHTMHTKELQPWKGYEKSACINLNKETLHACCPLGTKTNGDSLIHIQTYQPQQKQKGIKNYILSTQQRKITPYNTVIGPYAVKKEGSTIEVNNLITNTNRSFSLYESLNKRIQFRGTMAGVYFIIMAQKTYAVAADHTIIAEHKHSNQHWHTKIIAPERKIQKFFCTSSIEYISPNQCITIWDPYGNKITSLALPNRYRGEFHPYSPKKHTYLVSNDKQHFCITTPPIYKSTERRHKNLHIFDENGKHKHKVCDYVSRSYNLATNRFLTYCHNIVKQKEKIKNGIQTIRSAKLPYPLDLTNTPCLQSSNGKYYALQQKTTDAQPYFSVFRSTTLKNMLFALGTIQAFTNGSRELVTLSPNKTSIDVYTMKNCKQTLSLQLPYILKKKNITYKSVTLTDDDKHILAHTSNNTLIYFSLPCNKALCYALLNNLKIAYKSDIRFIF